MTSKAAIVERLGETAVLLPSLIGDALTANDQIKLRLSLLQEAAVHAQAPQRDARHFGPDKGAVGLAGFVLDTFVAGARLLGPGKLLIPGVRALLAGVANDLATMLAPLQAAGDEAARSLAARVETLTSQIPEAADDQLDVRVIDELTSANRAERDTVHLLVMDLHKALNRLVAAPLDVLRYRFLRPSSSTLGAGQLFPPEFVQVKIKEAKQLLRLLQSEPSHSSDQSE